jgi:hypothetical protein
VSGCRQAKVNDIPRHPSPITARDGDPHPDGTQRIRNASNELTAEREAMMKAHNRLTDFLNTGIVPDDLKRRAANSRRLAGSREVPLPPAATLLFFYLSK